MKASRSRMSYISRSALFSAMIFLGTYLLRIPIPYGYIHFGDGFIYAAAALLSPAYAMSAAAVGGVLSDVLSGYALYAPWTALVKALSALPMALLCRKHRGILSKADRKRTVRDILWVVIALLSAGIVQVGGYFLADFCLYNLPAAVAGIPMNMIQSATGAAVFLLAAPIIRKAA